MQNGITGGTWDRNHGNRIMRIDREDSTALVVDIQEKLFPHMFQKELFLQRCLVLLEGLKILGIPVIRTEQYPRGLGPTLREIHQVVKPEASMEKISFSCCDEPDFRMALEQSGRKKILICGIETHVCILQTALDLLHAGYLPVIVTDCVSSRREEDKRVALQRMGQEGAILTTSESLLFELTRFAGTEQFKAISKLVK